MVLEDELTIGSTMKYASRFTFSKARPADLPIARPWPKQLFARPSNI
jgi:hypothetical protein